MVVISVDIVGCVPPADSVDSSLQLTASPLHQSAPSPLAILEIEGTPPANSIPADLAALPQVAQAKADLANRLIISPDHIAVVDVQMKTWSDSSLGCPQPGMVYPQVPEDGLLIRLQVGGQIYPYHSGGFRDPFLCEMVYKDPNPPPKIDFFNLTPSGSTTPDNSIPPGEDK
ncbi:MAG: hypothetical protein ACT4QE_26115 [Anaerolineales bacterium]